MHTETMHASVWEAEHLGRRDNHSAPLWHKATRKTDSSTYQAAIRASYVSRTAPGGS
jgi:hypothetical protein